MNGAKLWFWVLLDVFLAAAIIAVIGFGVPLVESYMSSVPPARTLTVTSQGKTTAAPDLAEVTFSVVTAGQDPQTLTENNVSKMNAALEFLSSQGIATSDIATTGYNLQPAYNYDSTAKRNYITGYTLTQTVQVKIHDLTKVASVIGGLTPLGVNQVGSIDFTFSDQDQYVAIARADAINKDEIKAQEMAAQAGAVLGPVVNISENVFVPQPYPVYSMATGLGGAPTAAVSTPNIQPGTQDITDNVTMTYALR
jgi:uncharacterized protein YggE